MQTFSKITMSKNQNQTRTRRRKEWCEEQLGITQLRIQNVASKLEGIAGLLKMSATPDHRSILVGVGASLSDFEEELDVVVSDLRAIKHNL